MNENIGAKGGTNDRRRTLKITKAQKENLEKLKSLSKEEEIKALEEKVRKQQLLNLITLVPIVLVGGIFYAFKPKKEEKKKQKDAKENGLSDNPFYKNELYYDDIFSRNEERFEEIKRLDEKPVTVDSKKEVEEIKFQKEKEKIEKENKNVVGIDRLEVTDKKERGKEFEQKQLEEEIAKAKSKKIVEEYENKVKEIRTNLRNIYLMRRF